MFNKLYSGSIRLPRNQYNLVSELRMSPSGWKEVVLPPNRSEISKMLSVKRKCWPFHDDRRAVASVWFSVLLCHQCGIRNGSEKRRTGDACISVLWPVHCHFGLPASSSAALAPLCGSHLHFLLAGLDFWGTFRPGISTPP